MTLPASALDHFLEGRGVECLSGRKGGFRGEADLSVQIGGCGLHQLQGIGRFGAAASGVVQLAGQK
ncbi:MAG: hypothetical protein ACKPEA_00845, partial [Planctomycetota bacterium]